MVEWIFMQGIFSFIFNRLRKYSASVVCGYFTKNWYISFPSTLKAQRPFICASCCEKKKKNNNKKLLNSAKSTCQRQFPSPTNSDIKMVTFSPTLQSSPSQVCEFFIYFFFIFSLLRCLTPMPPCFPLKTFLFALYISALSPFCPLLFNMSIFLSLFISFSLNLSLSLSRSQF